MPCVVLLPTFNLSIGGGVFFKKFFGGVNFDFMGPQSVPRAPTIYLFPSGHIREREEKEKRRKNIIGPAED